mgnify:CR=1 FL=1
MKEILLFYQPSIVLSYTAKMPQDFLNMKAYNLQYEPLLLFLRGRPTASNVDLTYTSFF